MASDAGNVRLGGATLRPPCHACAFFHTKEEEYELLLPFIREGFEQGEKTFHIIDECRRDEYVKRLSAMGIAAEKARDGRLEIRGWENAHLQAGRFDQHAMLSLVEEVFKGAKEQGFEHTRWVASMAWALEDKSGVADLVEYCARLNYVVPKYSATVICTYDLTRFTAAQVVDVLRSHPLAVIGGLVQQNPYYVPPESLLKELRDPAQRAAIN